jgi:threonine/homoserine/homoserine lactone efflux protein
MMYAPALLALAGIHLLAVASPGPAFVATIQISVRQSRGNALLHSLGLGLGVFTWAAGALFGLQALMLHVSWLYRTLQLAGGLYLVYIGVQSWRHAKNPIAAGSFPEGKDLTGRSALRRGFSTNLANPKVMVFFASIFSAVLDPGWPRWVRLSALIIVFMNETVWNGALALLLSTARAQSAYMRAKAAIDRTAGSFMTLFGCRLIWGATGAAVTQP